MKYRFNSPFSAVFLPPGLTCAQNSPIIMKNIRREGVFGMGIVVIGAAFVDIKGFPKDNYIANGRNVGRIEYVHVGVARNVV